MGKQDESFSPEELKAMRKVDGIKRVGGFVRNQFPLTLHIWPSGKVGFGAAAKTDLFFESIPEEFLDFTLQNWDWDENSSIIPIIVPKFYLDLWNFALHLQWNIPLSMEAAMGMPIQVFIGKTDNPHLMADSSRLANASTACSFLKVP